MIECSFDCPRHHPHEIVLPVPDYHDSLAHVGLDLLSSPAWKGYAHRLRLATARTLAPELSDDIPGHRANILQNAGNLAALGGEDVHSSIPRT